MKLIVKGRAYDASREYIKSAIGRLLSRAELLEEEKDPSANQENLPVRMPRDKPVPLEITKTATVSGVPSYHVSWRACATVTDDEGKGIDGYEYSTVEPRELMQRRFPKIVEKYLQAEKDRLKQGDGEQNRRKAFLSSLWVDVSHPTDADVEKPDKLEPSPRKRRDKRRKGFFCDGKPHRPKPTKPKKSGQGGSDDVCQLLRCIKHRPTARMEDSSIESTVAVSISSHDSKRYDRSKHASPKKEKGDEYSPPSSPLFCHFGSFLIPITPVDAMRPGEYPPRRIYVRRDHSSER